MVDCNAKPNALKYLKKNFGQRLHLAKCKYFYNLTPSQGALWYTNIFVI